MKTMKKTMFAAGVVLAMLMMPAAVMADMPDSAVTVIDPARMTTEGQSTQHPDFRFEVTENEGTPVIRMHLEGGDGWGWLVFDQYDGSILWDSFNTAVLKIENPGEEDILFGFNGMPASGPRIEFSLSDIVAVTEDGEVLADDISAVTMDGPGVVEWGSGDPYVTIPAGFDGYFLFPFETAFRDDGFDIAAIDSMAAFLNGQSAYDGYVLVESITMCEEDTAEVLEALFPAPETEAETVTVPETDEPAAPQTFDITGLSAAAAVLTGVSLVTARRKKN